MPCNKIITLLIIALTLTACSGKERKPPPLDAILKTDIKDNGIKIFVYQASPRMKADSGHPSRKSGSGPGGPKGQKKPGKPNHDFIMDALKKSLDETLLTSGYCREGYIELDSYSGRDLARIRGECKEGATKEDRRLFPNNNSDNSYRI